MNRFTISEKDFPAAKKFLKNGEDRLSAPNWCIKFKDDLSVKGNKILFKNDLCVEDLLLFLFKIG